jgi:hypothetical protein
MTVIAGVALGFILAVVFTESVLAAYDYMNRRVGSEKKVFIGTSIPLPS